MRSRSGRWVFHSLTLALAGLVLLGGPRNAHATLALQAFVDGVLEVTIPAGNNGANEIDLGTTTVPLILNAPNGNTLQVFGSVSVTNALGGSGVAQLNSSALSILNAPVGSPPAVNPNTTHTISLHITSTGFTFPASPILLSGSASGQFSIITNSGATTVLGDSAHAWAFADPSNTLFGEPTGTPGPLPVPTSATAVTVLNSGVLTAVDATNSPYSSGPTGVVLGYSGAYSMTERLDFTLTKNTELVGRQNVETAIGVVPEPATLAMAFSALPLLGLAAWRKRRKSA